MRAYTNNEPVFVKSIQIVETTDPAHADNINMAPEALLDNTLVLMSYIESICNETNIEDEFYQVFTLVKEEPEVQDPTAMTSTDIEDALNTTWNGESSEDITAMSAEDVNVSLNTEWKGESSQDETAMSAEEIASVIGE